MGAVKDSKGVEAVAVRGSRILNPFFALLFKEIL